MSRFSKMLDRTAEDIKAPPTLPPGIYTARVARPHEVTEIDSARTGKQFEKVTFTLEITGVHEVEDELLAEYGREPQGTKLTQDFLFDQNDDNAAEDTLNRLKNFLVHHLQVMDANTPLSEAMASAVGAECLIEVINEADNRPDSDRVFARIRRTLAL